jgi:hypothetical protein
VLDEFCEAHGFAHGAEVLFHIAEGVDGGLRVVCAQRVPGQEAREVLDCAEGFVAADLEGVRGWLVLIVGTGRFVLVCIDRVVGVSACGHLRVVATNFW